METNARNYRISIVTPASPKEAMDKIARVSEWWAKDIEGSTRQLGDTFTVRFGDTFAAFKISELVPEQKVTWDVIDCYLSWLKDKTEWTGSKVAWEITPGQAGTTIEMTHVGLVPGIECYNDCKLGWDNYATQSLLKFLNEGAGQPNKF